MISPAVSRAAAVALARQMPPARDRRAVAQAAMDAAGDAEFTAAAGRILGELPGVAAASWVERLHPRGPHGRFARKPGGPPLTTVPGTVGAQAKIAALRATIEGEANAALLRHDATAIPVKVAAGLIAKRTPGTDWRSKAAGYLGEASRRAKAGGDDTHAARYAELAHQALNLPDPPLDLTSLRDYTAGAAQVVPRLLGGGDQKWDGTIGLFTKDEHPGIAGFMSWGGHLQLLDRYAADLDRHLADAAASPDGKTTISDAYPVDTVLHELIHGVEGGRTEQAAKDWDALDRVGKSAVETFDRLDRDAADGGKIPHAHTFEEIHRENLEITQDRVDQLTQAGVLRKADFSEGVYDPDTGRTDYKPLWLLTSKGRGMLPGDRYSVEDHSRAYGRQEAEADIEEGFTELGATMHMPDLARQTGIGDWETGVLAEDAGHAVDNPLWQRRKDHLVAQMQQVRAELTTEAEGPHDQATWQREIARLTHAISAVDDGDDTGPAADVAAEITHLGTPVNVARGKDIAALVKSLEATPHLRHATLAEYADRLADPARIADGNSWGAYKMRTMVAQEWVQAVAEAEGRRNVDRPGTPGYKRAVELADEINRQGPAGKIPMMAAQVIRAASPGYDATTLHQGEIEQVIRARWMNAKGQGHVVFADAWSKVAPPRRRPRRTAAPAAAAPPVSAALTPEGQEAERILAWAWADPEARVQQAIGQVDDLARAADGNTPALRDIQSAGTMLARLAGTLTTPDTAAAGWDEHKHPRNWLGRWARTGQGGPGPDITSRAQAHIAKLAGRIRLRELDEYNTAEYEDTRLDPAFTYTPEQRAALDRYSDHSFELNSAARGQPVTSPRLGVDQLAADTAALSAAMQPMPDDLILLREIKGKDALADVQPGDVIADAAFSSATLRPGRFAAHRDDTTVLHILTPKGTPVAWVGRGEDEILFDRDTPMVVISKRPGPGRFADYTTDVNVLVLPKDLTV